VRFADGEALRYDLLLAVPPHRAPRVVQEAGLTDASGWIPVHPSTLDTAHPRVHAVGDVCAVKLPGAGFLPKAGIMAERQGEVVAARVLAALEGGASEREFDGEGYCFFEVGGGKAMQMEGSFFAEPGKRVRFSDPAAEAYALKVKFERDRLARWFG
jgi:sulfide:quinone oxidoreductase